MMMAENAGGVRRSLAHDESAREKQTPLTLRNEAQLNCVSLRPEFDCEVTWGAVKGQDERPLRGALDSSPSHHRRFGKELIKDGRHVGLDFLRPSHRSIQTIRLEPTQSTVMVLIFLFANKTLNELLESPELAFPRNLPTGFPERQI